MMRVATATIRARSHFALATAAFAGAHEVQEEIKDLEWAQHLSRYGKAVIIASQMRVRTKAVLRVLVARRAEIETKKLDGCTIGKREFEAVGQNLKVSLRFLNTQLKVKSCPVRSPREVW